MKYKTVKKEQQNDDPIISLFGMKGLSPFKDIIQDIGYDRFFMHYWSTTEINLYRLYSKSTNTPTISIDATGGIVRKATLMSGRVTGNIFLYEIGVMDHNNKCQFSIAHMLSERHDNNSIGYWLCEWLRTGVPFPKVIITDQSLALMMGVVKAFTQYSTLTKYLQTCSLLINKKPSEIPKCMIHNDFNHVMHIFSSWFGKKTTKRIKNFYMRSLGLIVATTDFEDIIIILKFIFTVALSEADGFSNGEPTNCEKAKQYLKKRIATGIIQNDDFDNYIDDEDSKLYNREENEIFVKNEIASIESENYELHEVIKDIHNNCLQESIKNGHIGDRDNMQYDPNIGKKLVAFCKLLPCWSAVMLPIFKYGNITKTSSTSESLFQNLKSIVFKHKQLPVRIDEFLEIHATSILGSNNIIKSNYEHDKPHKSKEISSDSFCVIEKEQDIENWMGLGVTKKKSKPNFLAIDPTISHYNENSRTKSQVIGILRNGICSDLLPINIDGLNYTFSNTCTFDSVFQLLCTTYVDDNQYMKFLNKNIEYDRFLKLVSCALRDGINVQTYNKRAVILKRYHEKELKAITYNMFNINCATTANYTIGRVFENWPSLTEKICCSDCKRKSHRSFPSILANMQTDTIDFLEDVVQHCLNVDSLICLSCGSNNVIAEKNLGQQMFIETFVPNLDKKNKANFDLVVALEYIPKQLNLNTSRILKLRGVIAFIPPASKYQHSIGHYITYCWRDHNKLWE